MFEYVEPVSNLLDDIVAGRLILEYGTAYTSTDRWVQLWTDGD